MIDSILSALLHTFCGMVIGSASVFYLAGITRGMKLERRKKILLYFGVPFGGLMSLVPIFFTYYIF